MKIEEEKLVVTRMVHLYCRSKEGNEQLCDNCKALLDYAYARLSRCKFGDQKPTCRRCSIHCYNPVMRERMKSVMRYAGPRMMFYAPQTAIKHLFSEAFGRNIGLTRS